MTTLLLLLINTCITMYEYIYIFIYIRSSCVHDKKTIQHLCTFVNTSSQMVSGGDHFYYPGAVPVAVRRENNNTIDP